MAIFDVFRAGYQLGQQHGQRAERRRPVWELQLSKIWLWLPGIDQVSFFQGYQAGYEDGMRMRSAMQQIRSP